MMISITADRKNGRSLFESESSMALDYQKEWKEIH